MRRKSDFSPETRFVNKDNSEIAFDFSRENIINIPKGDTMVHFSRNDKVVRPTKDKIKLGSYISEYDLKQIIHKEFKNRHYYSILDTLKKGSADEQTISKDFMIFKDFFLREVTLEVQNYGQKIIPKVKKMELENHPEKSCFTPRKRRALILAVYRSFCRKNGKKITDELLDEINNRFNNKRKMQLKEVIRWENKLVSYKLLAKNHEQNFDKIRHFYKLVIKQTTLLKSNPEMQVNKQYLEVLEKAKKKLTACLIDKTMKERLQSIIRHKDVDYATRIILWSIVKNIAIGEYDLLLKIATNLPEWQELFVLDYDQYQQPIYIQSAKYIFWNEFQIRKELIKHDLL